MFKKLTVSLIALAVFALVNAQGVEAVVKPRPRWVFVRDSRVNGKVRCAIYAKYRPDDPNSATVMISWRTTIDGGWHVLNWGDGNTYGSIKKFGTERHTHYYNQFGSYPVTFTTDAVDGNEVSCGVNINFNFAPTN